MDKKMTKPYLTENTFTLEGLLSYLNENDGEIFTADLLKKRVELQRKLGISDPQAQGIVEQFVHYYQNSDDQSNNWIDMFDTFFTVVALESMRDAPRKRTNH